jgi:ferredoxin-thioredoxin reductase catalytic subunit
MDKIEISQKEIDEAYEKLKKETEARGYFLNADVEFVKNLIRGLLTNENRYGYWLCPCRLSSGSREKDLDVICPCDYKDDDLNDFGCCYCSLYVSYENLINKTYKSIPERRKKVISISEMGSKAKAFESGTEIEDSRDAAEAVNRLKGGKMEEKNKLPVWRCKVCGYLCAREHPPEKCPICGVDSDRFEKWE